MIDVSSRTEPELGYVLASTKHDREIIDSRCYKAAGVEIVISSEYEQLLVGNFE